MNTWNSLAANGLGLVVAVVSTTGTAEAQFTQVPGTPYYMQRTPISYQRLPKQGAGACTGLGQPQYTESHSLTLPFTFRFYDSDETEVLVTDQGRLTFGSFRPLYYVNYSLGAGSPNEWITPFSTAYMGHYTFYANDDFFCHKTVGQAPNRKWIVEWQDTWYSLAQSGSTDYRIVLHEGPFRRIDIEYGPVNGSYSWSSAVMGMEDAAGARAVYFAPSGCTSGCTQSDLNSVANSRITFIQDAGVELAAGAINAPPFAFLNAVVDVPVEVASVHANPIGPFSVSVEASLTEDFANPVRIGTLDNITLTAFESKIVEVESTPPLSLGVGQVFLRGVVDSTDVITEVLEDNNTVSSQTVTRLIEGAPDLSVERVDVAGTAFDAGDSIDITTRVRNLGGETATDVPVRLMLSTNPVISRQDVGLGTFTVTLAPGATLNETTMVTIPRGTNSGTYYFGALADPDDTLPELSDTNNGLATFGTSVVTGASLGITTTRLPRGTLRVPYVALIEAVGTGEDFSWRVTEGSLPSGLGLVSNTGEIFGRPIEVGSETFTVEVTSNGETASTELTLDIVDPEAPLTIVSRNLPPAVVGQEYTFELVVAGGASADDTAWGATDLPEGFTVNDDGMLAGTADAAGTTQATFRVTAGGETATREMTFEVLQNPNLLIVPNSLASAIYGAEYTAQLRAQGGLPPYTWILESGALPEGITLSSSGEISGTPNEVGTFRFVVEARDSAIATRAARDQNAFELVVLDTGGFTISTQALPYAVLDVGYDESIAAGGGSPPYTWILEEGRIPEGLVGEVDPNTGEYRIRGQPTEVGTTNLLLAVTDIQGRQAQRAFALTVLETDPSVEPETSDDSSDCTCTDASGTGGASSAGLLLLGVLGLAFLRRRS